MPKVVDYVGALPSAAHTTTQHSTVVTNYDHRGCKIVWDISAGTSLSLVLTLEIYDKASGQYVTVLTSASKTGVSTTTLTLYPAVTASANVAVSDILGNQWRVTVTASNANSATYSVGVHLIP